jgi:C-terminal processing protease CtpA/Prc
MKSILSIGEQVKESLLSLPEWHNLEDFVQEFHSLWLSLGQKVQQHLVQEKIEEIEAQYQGARTKREKRYYTPLGEMVLKRRVYLTEKGLDIKADEELELPSGKGLSV